MSESSVQKLPKPQLRNLFRSLLKRHLAFSIVAGIAASAAWKYGVMEPRKKRYADFYRTYDPEEHWRSMEAAGVVPAFPELEWKEDDEL